MNSIYFVSTYKPAICGIAEYMSFITQESPVGQWGVISFDLDKFGGMLIGEHAPAEQVWYGIPKHDGLRASVIHQGMRKLPLQEGSKVVWFQHENGIWPDDERFITTMSDLGLPKIVTLHTLHFQSAETESGLCRTEYQFLKELLPRVDAITVFSYGVYRAVTSAFPEYREKVYILKHGISLHPEVSRLSRKEAKEKLNDFLLYESDLDNSTRETLHRQQVLSDSDTFIIGETGFMCPMKNSQLLYSVRDSLACEVPHKKIVALRIGAPRDSIQRIYAGKLRAEQNERDKFLAQTCLPTHMLPVAQKAFDINLYWPDRCTQSGIVACALGVGAMIAGRNMEGSGEMLREAGAIVKDDLGSIVAGIRKLLLNPAIGEEIEERELRYAKEFSWKNQAGKHYDLASHILRKRISRSEISQYLANDPDVVTPIGGVYSSANQDKVTDGCSRESITIKLFHGPGWEAGPKTNYKEVSCGSTKMETHSGTYPVEPVEGTGRTGAAF